MQDNVIDQTYYFLDKNKEQALGERRLEWSYGLHDLLIHANLRYGSKNLLVNQLFRFITNEGLYGKC